MSRRIVPLLAALVLGLASTVLAGPGTPPQPGQAAAVLPRTGATLRSGPQVLSKGVAVLPYGTRLVVNEVQPGWVKVTASGVLGPNPSPTGWLKETDLADPAAVAAAGGPVAAGGVGTGGVSERDVSAAGRRLDAETERRYRGQKPNLAAAYPYVDMMETISSTMDPNAIVAFVRAGRFGANRQIRTTPFVERTQPPQGGGGGNRSGGGGRKGPLGGLGGLIDKGLEEAGLGGKGKEIVGAAIEGAAGYAQELNKKFTPEQEYYLGRAVAANAIAQYGLDPDPERRQYVQMLGQAIVRTTDRLHPTWGGYHFDVLNSDEVNGISGPGGFVLITRGAVEAARNEDELAGILAHELTHVELKHGEKVIREGGKMQALVGGLSNVGLAGLGVDDPRFREALANFFDKVVGEMVRTSTEHAYGRDKEFESDLQGSYMLATLGMDYWALRDALGVIATKPHPHGGGATHAPPEQRAEWLGQQLARSYGPYPYLPAKQIRLARFQQSLGIAPTAPSGSSAPPPAPPK